MARHETHEMGLLHGIYMLQSQHMCYVNILKSALTPFSCVQSVAYRVKNHKPWECKKLMQVSFKWLIEPHEIGVWHLQRAKTILYSWDRKSKKKRLSDNSYLICTEYAHPLYVGSTSHNAHLTRVETQLNWSTYIIFSVHQISFPRFKYPVKKPCNPWLYYHTFIISMAQKPAISPSQNQDRRPRSMPGDVVPNASGRFEASFWSRWSNSRGSGMIRDWNIQKWENMGRPPTNNRSIGIKPHDGSMVLLYMVTFTINIPPMLAYIPYTDPMGTLKHCELSIKHWDWISNNVFLTSQTNLLLSCGYNGI